MNRTVLITGATAGIGKACACKFARENYRIIITGRREERLQELKLQLQKSYNAEVLIRTFDVQKRADVFRNIEDIPANWKDIDILINNAGLALGRESFDKADIDDWETMLHTNIDGLLFVTRAVLPGMIERKKGHIINMGSIAGKEVYEKGNVYCASKFAVDAINKAMRIDLLDHGIKVTAINPGAVETEFSLVRFKGDAEKARSAYSGYRPLSAEDVADTIFYCATLPPHVCINDLTITCLQQAGTYYFNKSG